MEELDKIVIDASLALCFLLPDEKEDKFFPKIAELIARHSQRKLTLIAPTLIVYEVNNGLKTALVRERLLSLKKARHQLEKFILLNIKLYDYLPISQESLILATKYNLSVYDAVYAALAKAEKCPLLTLDKKLFNKLKKNIPAIKFLGDNDILPAPSGGD